MIAYKRGYKYQLVKPYAIRTEIFPDTTVTSSGGFIELTQDGVLSIEKGYAWDGPSGPTFDTKTFMRGSLAHDALYELMREGLLSTDNRHKADDLLGKICREDGMCRLRAWYVVRSVKRFAGGAANPKNRKPILYAP